MAKLNLRGEPRQRGRTVGGNDVADEGADQDQHQFLLFLTFLWHYSTWTAFAREFHVHERTLAKYVHRVQNAFYNVVLEDEYCLHWPSDAEIAQLKKQWHDVLVGADPQWENVLFVVDGTEFPMHRSSRGDEAGFYSGKSRRYALLSLIVVLLNGEMVYASSPRRYHMDQQAWNDLGLRSLFEQSSELGRTQERIGVFGDSGFTFNLRSAPRDATIEGFTPTRMPNGRPRKGEPKPKRADVFTPDVIEHNRRLSQLRVVVENTIGHLKRWRILSDKYRGSLHGKGPVTFDKVHRIIVTMCNERIRRSPLRPDGWIPPAAPRSQEVTPT
jgi:hypothetical protein